MPGAAGELHIQITLHDRHWWLLAPVKVGDQILDMVIDTESPISAISVGIREVLARTDRLVQLEANTYVLRDPRIQVQSIADLEVRVSPRVTRVGADGVLGLDFLNRFTDVHFNVPSLRLTLK